jgi:hypothetical protein
MERPDVATASSDRLVREVIGLERRGVLIPAMPEPSIWREPFRFEISTGRSLRVVTHSLHSGYRRGLWLAGAVGG